MPAVRITKVMPIASRPVIDTCRITLKRLIDDRNRGSMIANSSHQHDEEERRREARDEAEDVETAWPRLGSATLVSVMRALMQAARASAAALVDSHHRHQDFLRRLVAGDLAGHAALAHRDDAVARPREFPAVPRR